MRPCIRTMWPRPLPTTHACHFFTQACGWYLRCSSKLTAKSARASHWLRHAVFIQGTQRCGIPAAPAALVNVLAGVVSCLGGCLQVDLKDKRRNIQRRDAQ